MDNTKHAKGKKGEEYTAEWLIRQGFSLLEMNYRTRFGEVDVIAENESYILFVEVKTRKKSSMYAPQEAVTAAKQRKILLAAQEYLMEHDVKKQARFDVAAVIAGDDIESFEYIENAFTA